MGGVVIVFCIDKGGAGKTTLSTQSALELSYRGKKVLVIDNDPQGDTTTTLLGENEDVYPDQVTLGDDKRGFSNTFGLYQNDWDMRPIEINENLFLFAANDSLSVIAGKNDTTSVNNFANSVDKLVEEYDIVIIDCPPSLGVLYTSGILSTVGIGGVIVPFAPDGFGVKSAKKMQKRLQEASLKFECELKILGFVVNKMSANNPIPNSVKYYLDIADTELDGEVFATKITTSLRISDATFLGKRVSEWVKADAKPATQIGSFIDEVCDRAGITRGIS